MLTLEKRNIASCILLSIFTLGIYKIYWAVMLGRECAGLRDQNDSGTTESLLLVFLPFLGSYLAEKKLYEAGGMMNINLPDNSILYLILGLFGWSIIDFALMQSDLNKVADQMARGQNWQYYQH